MAAYLLTPACKDYLWGGTRLRREYHIHSDCTPLAEAWVLSCHPDGPSLLPDGTPLPQYIREHPGCLGSHCEAFDDFPLLVKLIDAKGDLSIQVHPSDEYALTHEHQYGKTEMWVVLDAEPGAYLYYGFGRTITKEEFAARIRDNTLPSVLNAVPVEKGDVFFIPSGTLHAICHGILIAEIQQNSNVTYRVSDYGRLGPDGKPRTLHIDKALDVTTLSPAPTPDFGTHLGHCKYFTVDRRNGAFSGVADSSSFVSLLVTAGEGTLELDGQTMPLVPGSSIFIPADSGAYRVAGNCEVLITRV